MLRTANREIIKQWYRAQGVDWGAEVEGAKEELARLEACS